MLPGCRLPLVIHRANPPKHGSSLNRVGRFPGFWYPVT